MSGGKGGGSSPPPAPDPGEVAARQGAANVQTAIANSYLNNVNQKTPGGTLTYNKIGTTTVDGKEVPQWEAVTALSPEQQKLFDTQQAVSQGTADLAKQYSGRIADATREPFSYNGIPAAPTYNQDYIDQTRNQILARNQPQMDRDRAALEQKLANQGIGLGTEAYGNALDTYNRGVNDFRLGADVQAANTAAQRFGLEDATRKNAITERQALRTQPISEVSSLIGTGNGVQYPQFTPTNNYQIAPTDVAGIYGNNYAAQMAGWNAQQQQAQRSSGGMMSGLFGLGAAGISAMPFLLSDERAKENIEKVGKTNDGQNIYTYNYKGGNVPQIGLLAQEVERKHPEAVVDLPSGLKAVRYDLALASAAKGRR